jgi:hypothetical protein
MKLKTKRKTKFSARDAAKISKVVRELREKRQFSDCGNDRVLSIVSAIEDQIANASLRGDSLTNLDNIASLLVNDFDDGEIEEAFWIISKQGYSIEHITGRRLIVTWGDERRFCQKPLKIRKRKNFVYR